MHLAPPMLNSLQPNLLSFTKELDWASTGDATWLKTYVTVALRGINARRQVMCSDTLWSAASCFNPLSAMGTLWWPVIVSLNIISTERVNPLSAMGDLWHPSIGVKGESLLWWVGMTDVWAAVPHSPHIHHPHPSSCHRGDGGLSLYGLVLMCPFYRSHFHPI